MFSVLRNPSLILMTLTSQPIPETSGRILILSRQFTKSSLNYEEFRTLDIIKSKSIKYGARRKREVKLVPPPRYKKMPIDQDWPSVWPVARTFHPASVPLPLHQGYVHPRKQKSTPGKFANLELMKIPNFLHLTPPAIQRHCEAIKKFCTPWPEELEEKANTRKHFPLEIISSDYLHSSPSIRDVRARIVTLRVKAADLKFDEHAFDKFRRIVGNRYDEKSDYFTLVVDACPLRKQNFDYGVYLLIALYYESKNTESWEAEKDLEDMEKYVWEGSPSQLRLTELLTKISQCPDDTQKPTYLEPLEGSIVSQENITIVKPVQEYRTATLEIHNIEENMNSVEAYGKSVRSLFNLPQRT